MSALPQLILDQLNMSCESRPMTKSISPEFEIVAIEGPSGAFGIAFTGAHKDGRRYRDAKRSFFFYVEFEWKPIRTVTILFTSGVRATPEEWQAIGLDIEFFFKTRNYLYPERAVTPGAEAQVVKFENWGAA